MLQNKNNATAKYIKNTNFRYFYTLKSIKSLIKSSICLDILQRLKNIKNVGGIRINCYFCLRQSIRKLSKYDKNNEYKESDMGGGISRILAREGSYMGKMRLLGIIYYTGILVVSLALGVLGILGPSAPFFVHLNTIYLGVIIVLFLLYLFRCVRVDTALRLMIYATHLSTSIEIVYCTYHFASTYNQMLIVGNVTLLAINTIFALVMRLKYTLQVMSIWSMLIFMFATVVTGDKSLESFCYVYIVSFIFISILGVRLLKKMEVLHQENSTLKSNERELLDILRLHKQEVRAFVQLAKQNNDRDMSLHLFEMLSDKTQKVLMDNINSFVVHKKTELHTIESAFPELSQSEVEICRLILQGKKQTDICMLLDKSATNISTHRSHIRKKLNLLPADNLLDALKKRMETLA